MDNQERYDELDNFLSTLKALKDELKSEDLILELDNLIFACGYDDEKDELEKKLEEEAEEEQKEREREYWNSQF